MGRLPEGFLRQRVGVQDIVASAGYLYVTNDSGLHRVACDGAEVESGLAADGSHIHGADRYSGRVMRFDTSGSGACETLEWPEGAPESRWERHYMLAPEMHLAPPGPRGPEAPWHLVDGAEHLYVFMDRTLVPGRLNAYRLLRVRKADGATVELAAWEAQFGPFAAATDDRHVYFEAEVEGTGRTLARVPTGLTGPG